MKIKIKSLAAEAAIIRSEERKHTGAQRASLHQHRTVDVRREARAALLAYAFLRNKPLHTIERPGSRQPNWAYTFRIAKKFGTTTEALFNEWAGIDVKMKAAA